MMIMIYYIHGRWIQMADALWNIQDFN